jgi:hypothetical protein
MQIKSLMQVHQVVFFCPINAAVKSDSWNAGTSSISTIGCLRAQHFHQCFLGNRLLQSSLRNL